MAEILERFCELLLTPICFFIGHDSECIGDAVEQGELWTVKVWRCKRCGRISSHSAW